MRRATMARAIACSAALATMAVPAAAQADSYGTGFEEFAAGSIDGQGGWAQAATLDAEVLGAGLRMSNAQVPASIRRQLLTPALSAPAGEAGKDQFEASFDFTSTEADQQAGLSLQVAPDNGVGSRSSSVRITDEADGLSVTVFGVTDNGPGNAVDYVGDTVVEGLVRDVPHSLRLEIDYADGPANDVLRVWVDGALGYEGGTWEQYYRNDPEQAINGNALPEVSSLLFHVTGGDGAAPALDGQGLVFDNVSVATPVDPPPVVPPPTTVPPPPLVQQDEQPGPSTTRVPDAPAAFRVGGSSGRTAALRQDGFLTRRTVALRLRCSDRCTVRASGRLSLRVGGKPVRLRVVNRTIGAGKSRRLALAIGPKARRALRRALRDRRVVRAHVVLKVRDASGTTRLVRRTVRLTL